MRFLPLILGALVLAVPAKADKFWLSDPAEQEKAAPGSAPDVVHGVLLLEDEAGYHVRVVGGEVVLPKASVFRVDSDDLTLEAVTAAEAESKGRGARANEERRLAQQVRRAERDVRIAEASARRSARSTAQASGTRRTAESERFDPVVGVSTGPNAQFEEIRAARAAWSRTGDRRYLRELRRLRRLR